MNLICVVCIVLSLANAAEEEFDPNNILDRIPTACVDQITCVTTEYSWWVEYHTVGGRGAAGERDRYELAYEQCKEEFENSFGSLLNWEAQEQLLQMIKSYSWYNTNSRSKRTRVEAAEALQNYETARDWLSGKMFTSRFMRSLEDTVIGRVLWVNHSRRNRNGWARDNDAQYKRGLNGLGTRDVELVSIVYDNDLARLVSTKPSTVDTITNDCCNMKSGSNSMQVGFTDTFTKSESFSRTFSFSNTISTTLEVNALFVKFGVTYSATFSWSNTFSHGTTRGESRSYSNTLTCTPGSATTGTFKLQLATVDMPYTIQMNLAGRPFMLKGTWRGVATSKATFKAEDIPCASAAVMMPLMSYNYSLSQLQEIPYAKIPAHDYAKIDYMHETEKTFDYFCDDGSKPNVNGCCGSKYGECPSGCKNRQHSALDTVPICSCFDCPAKKNELQAAAFPTWAVILGIVGSLCCIGGLICMFMAKQEKKQESEVNDYNKF